MRNRQGKPSKSASRPSALKRAGVFAYLVLLLGMGEPLSICGVVHLHRLLVAPESVSLAEEFSEAGLAAPRSSMHPRSPRSPASGAYRVARAEDDRGPTRPPAGYGYPPRQPALPCGVAVPIRC